tara:strand:- start:1015 stop:1215 length:201 start_codon:yes stop_codon:yes gene_type:complete
MPALDLKMPKGKDVKKLSPVCTKDDLKKVERIINHNRKSRPYYGVTDLFRDLVSEEYDRIEQLDEV